jgi:NADH-quinone oxidoreductase subunit H
MDALTVLMTLLKILIVLLALPVLVGFSTWAERKVLGRLQIRYGPNRAGPFGMLQWAADAVKLITKEYVVPAAANRWLFVAAPLFTLVPAVTVYTLIPFGRGMAITDVNAGLLMLVAIGSLSIYGIIFGGWASNSKYSLLGALRSASQMIAYELALGLALVGVVLMAGTLSLVEIVESQRRIPFIVLQPLGFLIFLIAGIAETNRIPFDLPEAEGELGAGYHTEYSAMGFGIFQLAEYASVWTISALAATLFLGGWQGPGAGTVVGISFLWFFLKSALFIFLFYWLRGTLPRLRYDQLMAFGWKVLLPASLLNLLWVAAVVAVRARL